MTEIMMTENGVNYDQNGHAIKCGAETGVIVIDNRQTALLCNATADVREYVVDQYGSVWRCQNHRRQNEVKANPFKGPDE